MAEPEAKGARNATMAALVVFLFFAWGFTTVLNDPLIAKLKGLFQLTYAEAMLTQFAFFLGYLVFSIPSGIVLGRIGYVRSIVIGLWVMGTGCLLFAPAAMVGSFAAFLVALFIVAAGITLLQVAANPYIAVLGPPRGAHSRLTLAQAFNSFGTFIAPFVGAMFFLQRGVAAPEGTDETARSAARIAEAQIVQGPFLAIAATLFVFALIFWLRRNAPGPRAESAGLNPFTRRVLGNARLMLGVVSIFLYVGAEVAIGSGLTNYLMQDSVLGSHAQAIGESAGGILRSMFGQTASFNKAQVAGATVSIYWGLAMVGRFVGSAVLMRRPPAKVLAAHAIGAAMLACVSALTAGVTAAAAVLLIGFANSVMFPTIFTLALEGVGEDAPKASALLCMAIVGGAIVPVIYGATADAYGLAHALFVPAICYVLVALYAVFAARGARTQQDVPVGLTP